MTISDINGVFQYAMVVTLKLAAPILVSSIVIGLVVAIFQAATQIHEQTLSFVPKLIAIALILIILGPWMMETLNDFTVYIFECVSNMS